MRATGRVARTPDAEHASMRVLGIDPGSRVCGYACVESITRSAPSRRAGPRIRNAATGIGGLGRSELVLAGALRLGASSCAIERRLATLARELSLCIEECRPDCLALEEAFFGKSVQSALRLGEARGVVLLVAAQHELAVHQYAPATIKLRVAGNGASAKSSVARMVQTSLGVPSGELSSDASDAAAIALCHIYAESSRLRIR